MNSAAEVWNLVLTLLGKELTPIALHTWFDDVVPVELTDSSLVLRTPTTLKYNIIDSRYREMIQDTLFNLFGTHTTLTLINQEASPPTSADPERNNRLLLDDQYSFSNFVVGNSNQFAYHAAMAVANKPGDIYNPLFIYGPSGLGKTHLLYSIANHLHELQPELRITYVKGEQFTNELILAIGQGTTAQFREHYRECDLLLMDDVQFIAGLDRTQEEFFHTFNSLYEAKKQIVLTADRTPSEMKHLQDRLCTRFQQGLLSDIQPPDYETRMAIIRKKAISLGLELPDSVVEYIAENITANVRQLEGTIRKILAYQELMGSSLDINTVIRAIRDIISQDEFMPSPDEIIEEVAKFYGLNPRDIKSTSRTKELNLARQLSIYLIRHNTSKSLKDIGKIFNRDHTTIMHAIEKADQLIHDKKEIAEVVKDITSNINSRNG